MRTGDRQGQRRSSRAGRRRDHHAANEGRDGRHRRRRSPRSTPAGSAAAQPAPAPQAAAPAPAPAAPAGTGRQSLSAGTASPAAQRIAAENRHRSRHRPRHRPRRPGHQAGYGLRRPGAAAKAPDLEPAVARSAATRREARHAAAVAQGIRHPRSRQAAHRRHRGEQAGGIRREPMTKIRRKIAERLVQAQQHGRHPHHLQRDRPDGRSGPPRQVQGALH